MDNINFNLANNIIHLRNIRGLSQQQLAKMSGIPRSTIAHIETREGNPSLAMVVKLARALSVSMEELIMPPRNECQLTKVNELERIKKNSSGGEVFNLFAKNIPGITFERLILPVGAVVVGTPHIKGTREYFHCTRGSISITVDKNIFGLSEGDVLSFPGDRKHSYRNFENREGHGISVVIFA